MKRNTRELLIFSAKFAPIFLGLALAWPWFAPAYVATTVGVANLLFPWVEEPDLSWLQAENNSVVIYMRDTNQELHRFGYLDYPHLGLLLLLALLLATPRITLRRLGLSGLACGLLFAVHVIYLIAETRFLYVNAFGAELAIPDGLYLRYAWLGRFLKFVSLVSPVVIWALLTFRDWFPWPPRPAAMPAPVVADNVKLKKHRRIQ
jgi:hypothetical protein